jgi:outer membrane protein assembly factor BamB
MRTATITLALFAAATLASAQANILVGDEKSQPESITVLADGTLIAGSATSPFVYRAKPGATTAEKFIDVSSEPAGTTFLGMLAEPGAHTLWTCQLTPVPDSQPRRRHTAVRAFDLATGQPKLRWDLPGDGNVCNDLTLGPDKALYISDTSNGRIFRLPHGATTATLFAENLDALKGIDGLTFLNGKLYVNNVSTNKLYRIPVANGKAGDPVEIATDLPLKGPDGMRAAHGRMYVVENGAGKLDALTISGDKATVTVLKDGLKTPTAVEPTVKAIWFSERAIGKVESIPLPK